MRGGVEALFVDRCASLSTGALGPLLQLSASEGPYRSLRLESGDTGGACNRYAASPAAIKADMSSHARSTKDGSAELVVSHTRIFRGLGTTTSQARERSFYRGNITKQTRPRLDYQNQAAEDVIDVAAAPARR